MSGSGWGERERALISFAFYKDTGTIKLGPTLMVSLNLCYLFMGPNSILLGIGALTCEFWRTQFSLQHPMTIGAWLGVRDLWWRTKGKSHSHLIWGCRAVWKETKLPLLPSGAVQLVNIILPHFSPRGSPSWFWVAVILTRRGKRKGDSWSLLLHP